MKLRFGLGTGILVLLVVSEACGLWIQNRRIQELQAESELRAAAFEENYGDFGGWHRWKWEGKKVDVESCLEELPGYSVKFEDAPESQRRVTLYEAGKAQFEWTDDGATVACVKADVLYLATYSPICSSCELSAVDLTTKEVLWKNKPIGLGPVQHSQYANALNLHVGTIRSTDFLVLYGSEGHGEYIEWIRMDIGQTFFHRIVELR